MKLNLLFISSAMALLVLGCSKDQLTQNEGSNMSTNKEFNQGFPKGEFAKNVDKTIGRESKYPTSKTIAVPYYAQETNYWCGPASAKMVNYYFNQPVSQATIAAYCNSAPAYGTYIGPIADWFNSAPKTGYLVLPSWWVWEVTSLASFTDFQNKVQWSFGGYSAPEVWLLMTYPSSTYHLPGWTSNCGHYVAGRGYDFTSNSKVYYQDPWYGTGGGANKTIDAYTMYYCINANANCMIY
ncbi:MAG: C39 family peptidase [Bacteroidales bacterium]|nr:C39 family peptidase [Bacteroidales bacterium]